MATSKTIGAREIHAAIERLAAAIAARHHDASNLLLLGIANGGVELARRLALNLSKELASSLHAVSSSKPSKKLGLIAIAGTLDISFHRDDIRRHPIPKEFAPTHISADVDGATVVLVDDVLFSGRTVKAALDELFDHGRPAKVELAVLVDRGGRLLPVAADYIGVNLTPSATEKVVVHLDLKEPKRDTIQVVSTNGSGKTSGLHAAENSPAASHPKVRGQNSRTKPRSAGSAAQSAIHNPKSAIA